METYSKNFKIRFAEEKDIPLILEFIRELAEYEKMLNEVTATEELLRESIFERKAAEVIIGEYEGAPVSFALFFHNFSTFLGKPGIYLEDLYVRPELRGKGIGKAMLSFLAGLAIERKCGRSGGVWTGTSHPFVFTGSSEPSRWMNGQYTESAAKLWMTLQKVYLNEINI